MRGSVYLSAPLSASIVSNYVMPGRENGGLRKLAPREREILRRLADGQSTRQIAGALRIAPKTVDTHRRRIMSKTHRHTLPDLTKFAIREGLTSLETDA